MPDAKDAGEQKEDHDVKNSFGERSASPGNHLEQAHAVVKGRELHQNG